MDPLIFVINELRKLNTIVENHFIKLPQIVAVGAQSAGKSSVIEGIVGWSFLPRGNDIVTRCPLVLNLVNVPEDDPRRQKSGITGDWATLDHISNKIFTDFEEVENEIRTKVPPKTVSSIPLILTIYSHKVVDLSLVDLPGTIKVNLEDKDNTMKQDIKAMVEEYVKNPKSLILAVTPANNDANNSDALHIAKKYDPERNRTLCVLTKIDLMDKGTNAYDLLTGKKFPAKLGIIGVRCRSQEEVLNKTSIEDCLTQEAEFFQKNYRLIARKNGMPYLRQQLNKLLVNHIAKHLPGLRDEINNMVNEQLTIQAELGAPPSEDPEMTVNEVIRIFSELFNKLLDGYQHDIETDKLVGGARINIAFKDFSSFQKIQPEDGLSQEVLINALRNSHGTRIPMFNSEFAFIQLAIRQMKRLKDPSVAFVDTIKNILLEIVDYCTDKITEQEKNRFPRLYKRINKIACDIVNERLQPTKSFVEELVEMQLNYINIRHREFDLNRPVENLLFGHQNKGLLQFSGKSQNNISHPLSNQSNPEDQKQLSDEEPANGEDENDDIPVETFLPSSIKKSSSTKDPKKKHVPSNFSFISSAPEDIEIEQCKKLQNYVIQYFSIVRESLQFLLPKAIMMKLVNFVKDNIHSELVKKIKALGNEVKDLTAESPQITQQREQTAAKIEDLETAKTLLQNITEINVM